MAQINLQVAKQQKKDEFYTQLVDIEKELRHYKEQFRGKVVLCNCDDPFESNFFKYFASNFKHLGLKKLIATSYTKSPVAGMQLPLPQIIGLQPTGKEPFKIEINEVPDVDGDGAVGITDVEYLLRHNKNTASPLAGNGDFRSDECVELLKQADIVVTNPPFSLFREFLNLLVEHKKDFLIIGNKNAITYRETFKLLKEDNMRTGYRNINSDMWFLLPDGAESWEKIDENGKKIKHIMACWFTTLPVPKHHEEMQLYKKYTPADYPKYDNYDAINVNVVSDIPADYDGVMGVPITYIDKHNPAQFEMIGQMATTKVDDFNHGYPYINGKKIYARLLIRRKAGA